MPGHVQLIDQGWKSYQRKMRELSRAEVKVGILADAGFYEGAEGFSIADVAIVNEFGSKDGRIPERPAHRTAFRENQTSIKNRLAASVRLVANGNTSSVTALKRVGKWYEGIVKHYIEHWTDPPNATSTKLAKGKKRHLPKGAEVDDPLVDEGRMKNAVVHKVTI